MSDDDEESDYGIGDHYADSDAYEGDDHGTDEHDDGHADSGHDEGHAGGDHASGLAGDDHADRVTSPMQAYTTTQVAWGGVVLVIGLLLTFGLGFAL